MALLKPPHKPELNCSPLDDPSLKVLISRSKCQILQFLHKNSLFSHDYSGQLGYHNLCSGSPHSNMHLLFRWGCPFPPPRREVQSLTHTHKHKKHSRSPLGIRKIPARVCVALLSQRENALRIKSQHSERNRGSSGCVEPVAQHHPSSPPQAKVRVLHLPRRQNIRQTQPPPYL